MNVLEQTNLAASQWVGKTFSLRASTNSMIISANLSLEADGAVGGFLHPDMTSWAAEGTNLRFLSASGVTSAIFDIGNPEASVLEGRFLLQPQEPKLWLERERFVDLTALADFFGTDKGTSFGDRHGYTEIYSALFEPFRLDSFTFLELGLLICNPTNEATPEIRSPDIMPSMDMWLSYFPKADCIGFDLSDFSAIRRPRFTFLRGDLSKDADVELLASRVGTPRIIIDDASHASFHQQRAFAALFPVLEPGGFYVVEDLHYSPPFENDLPACRRMWHVVRRYLDEKKLTLDFCTEAENAAISRDIEHVFVHCSTRGPNIWGPKLVVFQKRR